MRNQKRILWIAGFLLAIYMIFGFWNSKSLKLTTYVISGNKIPETFDGYRIAHVSDLHNTRFGVNNEELLGMLKATAPDMIAITGDLIDSRNTNLEAALSFVEQTMRIAPCYFVSGNHESRIQDYAMLKEKLAGLGVVVMEDVCMDLTRSGQRIRLMGVNDPAFDTGYLLGDSQDVMENKLNGFSIEDSSFSILLSHRPELFDVYAEKNIDLILSGHAHGGQIRLPFIGAVIAPNQGLFPKYNQGKYTNGNSNMIVSGGLGNSVVPFRFNNPPELVLIELKCDLP